jgi:hypothetical protein
MRVAMTAVIATLALGAAFACSKNDAPAGDKTPPSTSGSGSGSAAAMAGSGSAATMAGGSDMAGGGSGSGGAMTMAGSGSAGSAGSGMASDGSGGSGAGSGAFDFDKLDHKAQAQFMKDHVVGDMKVAFQAFDAKKFKDFDCKTCHGKDPKASHFKMPTPDLPKLDFAAIQAGKQKPKTVEFMEKTVKPQMAKILQQPEYDPVAKTGKFGCLACHEQKK